MFLLFSVSIMFVEKVEIVDQIPNSKYFQSYLTKEEK